MTCSLGLRRPISRLHFNDPSANSSYGSDGVAGNAGRTANDMVRASLDLQVRQFEAVKRDIVHSRSVGVVVSRKPAALDRNALHLSACNRAD